MKIIIVGHTGFIGKNILANLSNFKECSLQRISSKQVDLTKTDSVSQLSQYLTPDCLVIMCAAVKKQLGDNLDAFETNLSIITNFCRAVQIRPPRKIIFFSSASVYGEDETYIEKITELTPVQPKSYYGLAKFTAEKLVEKACSNSSTELVTVRPPLVYGTEDQSRGYGPTGFFYKALNHERIELWGDGSEYREFIYVDDIGKIIKSLVTSEFSGMLNLVSGVSYTFMEIIYILRNILGAELDIVSRDRSKQRVDHHYSNLQIKKLMGNFEFTKLEDGLTNMYESIKS